MKAILNYRPDLRDCQLEDRLVPVTPSLGATVLTTNGYVLVLSPFPVTVADPVGASGGPGFLTQSAMTGSGGIASLLRTNSTGGPGPATTAPTGSNGRAPVTIIVGSGADDDSVPTIPAVTHNTIVNDAVNGAPVIGRAPGDRSAVLPPEQIYQGGLPVTAPGGVSTEVPGQPAGSQPDERPAAPLKIRLASPPHRLALDASGSLVETNADQAPR